MKKLAFFFTLAITAITLSSKAQIQKGDKLIGADVGSYSFRYPDDAYINITPKMAWFVQDNLAVGGYVNVGSYFNDGEGNVGYGIGAFGRYYLGNTADVAKHARLFAEGDFGLMGLKHSNSVPGNGLDIGVAPGIAYFITPRISIEGLLKYDWGNRFGYYFEGQLTFVAGLQISLSGK